MIESESNPKVKQARALQRRRERARSGLCIVEGTRLVEDSLAGETAPTYLFFTDSARQEARNRALIERWAALAWEVSEPVMQAMTDTVTPQGIAAIVPQPRLAWPTVPTLLLVVDRLRDPGNLGTLLRAAAAVGVEGAIVPKGSVDPWNPKVLRAGMGAHFRLPLRDGLSWEEIVPLLDGLTLRLADAAGTVAYDRVDWCRPSALLVGGEAAGAGRAALRQSEEHLVIPMANEVESLNAAVAGSVILFEAQRQRRAAAGAPAAGML